jgi:thiamine transport system substrate-binding protein
MYRQIEYLGVVKGSKNQDLARQFEKFMLSAGVQQEIPLGNYMYPVRADVGLPEAFNTVELPKYSYPEISNGEKWLKTWEETFAN